MKKEYINPQVNVYYIKMQQALLAGSAKGLGVNDTDADPSGDVLAREFEDDFENDEFDMDEEDI
jgi:hypothetical protein